MTKVELLDAAAKRSGVTKNDAERVRCAFAIAVTSSTEYGGNVGRRSFGSFADRTVAAPKFTASSTLKADLNPTRK
jgi:nucleoid DNA-binding protein